MAYEKQTWTTGEVITQEKLNHMEDGIAESDAVIVELSGSSQPFTPSLTFSEISELIANGIYNIILHFNPATGVHFFYRLSRTSPYQIEFSCYDDNGQNLRTMKIPQNNFVSESTRNISS